MSTLETLAATEKRLNQAHETIEQTRARLETLRDAILDTQGRILAQAKDIARKNYNAIEERWESDEAYGRYTALLDCSTALNRLLSLNIEDNP